MWNCHIDRPVISSTALITSRGGAVAAGIGCNFWLRGIEEASDLLKSSFEYERFIPKITERERKIKLHFWFEAVKRSIGWLKSDECFNVCLFDEESENKQPN